MTERDRILEEVRTAAMEDEFATVLLSVLTNGQATPYSSAIEVNCFGEWNAPRVVPALLTATDEDVRNAWARAVAAGRFAP